MKIKGINRRISFHLYVLIVISAFHSSLFPSQSLVELHAVTSLFLHSPSKPHVTACLFQSDFPLKHQTTTKTQQSGSKYRRRKQFYHQSALVCQIYYAVILSHPDKANTPQKCMIRLRIMYNVNIDRSFSALLERWMLHHGEFLHPSPRLPKRAS